MIKGKRQLDLRLKALGNTQKFMSTLGTRTVYHAKKGVARKTGNTGRTIRKGRATANAIDVSAGGAAVFLEHGTKDSTKPILPRRAKALRFIAPSGSARLTGTPRRGTNVVFAKSARHKGMKAQPFMRPAADKAADEFGAVVTKAWNDAA